MYECTKVADNIPGAEGPCVNRSGEFFMVAPDRGLVLRVGDDGATTTFADTGGIPAGLQCDRDGVLWCADMKRGVLSIAPDGTVRAEVVEFDGKPMRGCNDCAFDSQGNLYVTAPAGSNAENPVGEIYCRLASGKAVQLDGGFQFCNGIAVRGDDRLLIVAETLTRTLWAYDIVSPGNVRNRRRWAVQAEGGLGPDGMDYDADGNLLATYWGGGTIDVFDPAGVLIEQIELPFKRPSNVHFGGPDRQTLFITEHDTNGLWKLRWKRPGQPQLCDRP